MCLVLPGLCTSYIQVHTEDKSIMHRNFPLHRRDVREFLEEEAVGDLEPRFQTSLTKRKQG